MKKGMRGITVLLVCLILLVVSPIQALAAGKILPSNDVALTISYKDYAKAIPNTKFNLYKVMDVDEYAILSLTGEFAPYKNTVSGLSDIENMDHDKWLDLAATLKGLVQRDNLAPIFSGKTDENGILSASLKPGLYLVVGYRTTTDDYYTYTATPYMIFLPGEDSQNNDWNYSVATSPKFEKDYYPPDEPDPVITRKALKVWDDAGYESIRPNEVIVQLLCDGKIKDTVTLNKDNNWRYAWDNLDAKHEWTVVEKELPGYAVTTVQNGITFTITNKYVAPITAVDPPVQKRIVGDKPETASKFTFVLTAKEASYPMPAGSTGTVKEISITGAGSAEFGDITFTKPGTYVYTISEKNSGVDGYTYDTTVYTVSYTVTQEDGELKVQRTISDSKANTVTAVEFTNSYKTPGNKVPQTGILWWPVPVLMFLGTLCVIAGVILRRRCKE